MYCYIIDCVVILPDGNIHGKSTATDLLELDHYCMKHHTNVFVSKPATYRTVRNTANIDHPLFIAGHSKLSDFLLIYNDNQFCYFLHCLRQAFCHCSIENNRSYLWLESIRDVLLNAKRDQIPAKRNRANTMLFLNMSTCMKKTVSRCVH